MAWLCDTVCYKDFGGVFFGSWGLGYVELVVIYFLATEGGIFWDGPFFIFGAVYAPNCDDSKR